MRRSSTTVSGPATLRLRRYGAKPLQNSNDNTRPSAPATIRMTPTVLRLNPEVVTSTAKVKIAPTRMLRQLTVRRACMHRLSIGPCLDPVYRTLCPALLLRFSAPTAARTSRRGWKRCRPRATPSDAIVGAVSPTMLSPGGRRPLQHHAAGSALSRRLVGDPAALWSLLAHLGRRTGTAGGRSAPVAWYVAQAADAQAMMPARGDVAVGTCG